MRNWDVVEFPSPISVASGRGGGERVRRGAGCERPRPVTVIPRWRGPQLRFFDAFPGLGLRLVPLVMWDARRRQRRYKRLIEKGRWPR